MVEGARRRRWRWPALLLGPPVLALLGLELALRAGGRGQKPAIFYDEAIGFRCRPGQERWLVLGDGRRTAQIRTNEHGFRGRFPPRARRPGVARLMAIGDSFTFGLGAQEPETYPAQLEAALAQRLGPARAEVLNLSAPGWNVANARAAYLALGREWRPDVLLLGFTMDDLRPNAQGVRYTDGWVMRLLWRTAIGELVQDRLLPRLPGYRPKPEPELAELRRAYERNGQQIVTDPRSELARPYVERAVSEIEHLRDELRSGGAELIVLLLPSRGQVDGLRSIPPGPEREAARAASTPLQGLIAEHCERLGIPHHDALDVLADPERQLMGALDRHHPSPEGYARLAAWIAELLIAGGYLD